MVEQTITCPNCKTEIPLTEAISHQIREQLKAQMEKENESKLKEARQRLEAELKKKFTDDFSLEMEDLKAQLSSKSEALGKAREQELALRKKSHELEEKMQSMDLEIARKVDEERKNIETKLAQKLEDEHSLKDKEKEKLIGDLSSQIEDLKRKVEQGSQQTQGEVLELVLEEALHQTFPLDTIEEVAKGRKGADVIQRVRNQKGQSCGVIYWETKNTKQWSDGWIDKLKEDQRAINAEVGVILTMVLPKEIKSFGLVDGIWVTDYASFRALATVLRIYLIKISEVKAGYEGGSETKEELFKYICSTRFVQNVEALVESFLTMQKDLVDERVKMERYWGSRESQLQKALQNLVRIFSDIHAIGGEAVPEIKNLDWKQLPPGVEQK